MDEQYWGLSGRPFQLTPDPRFWFETATHRKAMAYLGYGLAQGEGFIVITGDIGAGKTTLVGHLLETLDRQRVDPIKIVSTAIEAEDLLRIVAGQLGVEPDGLSKAQLLVAIERGLHAVARTGRRALLVVDEAQALPVSALEELRMLSNFQAGGHALLQIVLLGQPEFRDRLHGSDRLEQLRQRVIAIHHLDPMEEHEVADYLAHRLQVVGWQGRPDFAADAFEAFHRGSGGVPRRLNILAARVMLHASIERLAIIDARTVRAVLRDLHADLPHLSLEPTTDPVAAPATAQPVVARAPVVAAPPVAEERPTIHPRWFAAAVPPAIEAAPSPAAHRHAEPVARAAEPQEPRPAVAAPPWMPDQGRHEEEDVLVSAPPPPPVKAVESSPLLAEPVATENRDKDESDPALDLAERLARLELRMDDQDEALRRVLTLLVDWIEADERAAPIVANAEPVPIRGAATWTDAA